MTTQLKSWYEHSWSKFEVKSFCLGVLRKQFFPQYFTRGDYRLTAKDNKSLLAEIVIFKAPPENVKASPTAELIIMFPNEGDAVINEFYGVPVINVYSRAESSEILERVKGELGID